MQDPQLEDLLRCAERYQRTRGKDTSSKPAPRSKSLRDKHSEDSELENVLIICPSLKIDRKVSFRRPFQT
jgi:hypothetical protein